MFSVGKLYFVDAGKLQNHMGNYKIIWEITKSYGKLQKLGGKLQIDPFGKKDIGARNKSDLSGGFWEAL